MKENLSPVLLGLVKFCNILVHASLCNVYYMIAAVPAAEGTGVGSRCTDILCLALQFESSIGK